MKANHNLARQALLPRVVVVNISKSKNESKSQLYSLNTHIAPCCGKYQ